ncbi:uncharacterized protein LOC142540971 isoform X1 [Primulina tabacum]|uniref:uncharacterized protein LOC142540971 isoform X1 n=1 Tax=Primulina tabacum TaxID=48773 RepID=UPI003F5A05A7
MARVLNQRSPFCLFNPLCYSPSPWKAIFGALKQRLPFCLGAQERNKFTFGLLHCTSCVIIENLQQIKHMAISSTHTTYMPLEEKCTTLANLKPDIRNWFVRVFVSEKTPIRFLKWGRQQKLVSLTKRMEPFKELYMTRTLSSWTNYFNYTRHTTSGMLKLKK